MTILWRIVLNSSNPKVVTAFEEKLRKLLDEEIIIIKKEAYWKEEGKFELVIEQPLSGSQPPEIVTETLGSSAKLSAHWYITHPEHYQSMEGMEDFNGVADGGFKFQEIYWASFSLTA